MRWYNIVGMVLLCGPVIGAALALLVAIVMENPSAIFVILSVLLWVLGSIWLITKN